MTSCDRMLVCRIGNDRQQANPVPNGDRLVSLTRRQTPRATGIRKGQRREAAGPFVFWSSRPTYFSTFLTPGRYNLKMR